MSTMSRFLGLGVVLGLVAGLLVGVGLTQPGRVAATTPIAAPRVASGSGTAIAPTITTVTSGRNKRRDRRVCWSGDHPLPELRGRTKTRPRPHHRGHRHGAGDHAG